MKIKPNIQKDLPTRKDVDHMADEYYVLKDSRQSLDTKVAALSDKIKSLARKFGRKEGKTNVLFGDKYVIGNTCASGKLTIDPDKVRKVLDKALLAKVTKKVEVIDIDAVAKLADKGLITKKVFLSLLVEGESSNRVMVKTRVAYDKDSTRREAD